MSAAPINILSANGVGALLDANLNAFVQTGQTAAILRSFIGIAGMSVTLPGLVSAGDGGSGIFYWAAGSYTDNARTVIVPPGAAGEGAWLRATSLYAVPTYTVAGLPVITTANQGQVAYATNGRNTGEGAGAGTGCLCTVNANGAWAACWSGTAVLS